MQGNDRLRLFVGFPLPPDAAEALVAWSAGLDRGAARPVLPENLHVTLAFLGGRPAGDALRVAKALEELRGLERPTFRAAGYRETRGVAMLVLEDAGGRGGRIAAHVQERLEELGLYRRARSPWLPHVTVLRFRERPRLRPDLPALGEVSPSDAALYNSVLRSTGAQYQIIHAVSLGR